MSGRGPIHTGQFIWVNCPPYETDCVTCGRGGGNLVGGGEVTLLHRNNWSASDLQPVRDIEHEGVQGVDELNFAASPAKSTRRRSRVPVLTPAIKSTSETGTNNAPHRLPQEKRHQLDSGDEAHAEQPDDELRHARAQLHENHRHYNEQQDPRFQSPAAQSLFATARKNSILSLHSGSGSPSGGSS